MSSASQEPLGESRWPPAAALVVFIGFSVAARLWLPGQSAARVPWIVPSLEAALLVALVVGDLARLARRTPSVRRIAVAIVLLLVATALWAQSTVALALFGLAVARAVNAFT